MLDVVVCSFSFVFTNCYCLLSFTVAPKERGTFLEALRNVLSDDSFKIKSSEETEAREVA